MSKVKSLTEMIKSKKEMQMIQNFISEQEKEMPTNVLGIVVRLRLFIQKQKLMKESFKLLDEYTNLVLSFKFSEADKIKERIDELNTEMQKYNEAFDSLRHNLKHG